MWREGCLRCVYYGSSTSKTKGISIKTFSTTNQFSPSRQRRGFSSCFRHMDIVHTFFYCELLLCVTVSSVIIPVNTWAFGRLSVKVAAVAEAASVAAPMVSASQPHPNPQQYFRFIPFRNSPPIRHINISGLFHLGIVRPYPKICLILHT